VALPAPEAMPSQRTVLATQDALRAAEPLPSNHEMAIDRLTDQEWRAFQRALAEV
jgi:hypothetical protein